MISDLELKKQVKAINQQTLQEIAELLYDRWFYLLKASGVDCSVVSLCCLYCEEIYSSLFGCTIGSVHDLFIDLTYGDKEKFEMILKRNLKVC